METNKVNIYLESNPNPNSLKFVADRMLVEPGKNYDFPDKESTINAPLAAGLFGFSYVRRVFYMSNFITVTKSEEVEWLDIKDDLKDYIQKFLESGEEILLAQTREVEVEETDMDIKIRGLLDEYIKPAVEMDGGAIEYKSFEDGVVKVLLQGSCSGCPSSTVTLKMGIENLLKSMIPEVKSVQAEMA